MSHNTGHNKTTNKHTVLGGIMLTYYTSKSTNTWLPFNCHINTIVLLYMFDSDLLVNIFQPVTNLQDISQSRVKILAGFPGQMAKLTVCPRDHAGTQMTTDWPRSTTRQDAADQNM